MPRQEWKLRDTKEQFFHLANWGGLNNFTDTTKIEINEAQDLLNIQFTKELEKRGGYEVVNGTEISGSNENG